MLGILMKHIDVGSNERRHVEVGQLFLEIGLSRAQQVCHRIIHVDDVQVVVGHHQVGAHSLGSHHNQCTAIRLALEHGVSKLIWLCSVPWTDGRKKMALNAKLDANESKYRTQAETNR